MYSDPRHIRDHEVKVRLNEDEIQLLESLAQYNRSQRAVFARELLLSALSRVQGSDQQQHLLAS